MKKITFSVSTGYVGSERKETFTLEELNIDESLEGEELEKEIEEAYMEWLWENIYTSHYVED